MTVIIFILFTIGFLMLTLKNIRWAIFAIAALLPTYLIRFSVLGLPFTLLEVMLVIAIVVWGVKHHGFTTHNERISKWRLPLMLFLIAGLASIIVAGSAHAALGLFRAYIFEPILFFLMIVSVLHDERDVRRVFVALGFSALAISIYAIFQRITGFHIPAPWEAERRVTSFYPFPNAVGLFLAPLVPIFFTHTLTSTKNKPSNSVILNWPIGQFSITCFFTITTILPLIAIVFAKTVGALVGLAVGFFFMGIAYKKTRLPTIGAAILLMLIISLVPTIRTPLVQKLSLKTWSGHVRLTQWKETLPMLRDHALFGAGLSGYPTALKPYHKATYIEIFQYPHNIVLNFWTELGLLGLFAFGWIIIRFFRLRCGQMSDVRCQMFSASLMAAMITLLIHGLVDVPYFKNDLAIEFWIIVAAATILKNSSSIIKSNYEK